MTTYPNPGAIGDVITATKIESTWGNAIRDRVIQNFASAAARDAAIPSPVVGQFCYVAYSGVGTGLLQYCGATDGWQKPWNTPWGYLGSASLAASGAATAGNFNVTGLTLPLTVVANRLIKITLTMRNIAQVGAGSTDVGVAKTSTLIASVLTAQAAGSAAVGTVTALDTPAVGAVTYNARIQTTATTAQAIASATSVAWFYAEDIGPNGNPS